MSKSRVISLAAVALVSLAAAQASAEESSAAVVAPAPAAAPAAKDDGPNDHSLVVGRMGASYFGQFDVPYGALGTNAATQVIGVRYWTSETMAFDVGLGFSTTSGSVKSGNTTVDSPSLFGLTLMGGVPLTMLQGKHYTFFIEPQIRFGYASQSIKPAGGGDETKNTGYRVVLGATAGAEIQFGFIGIPHLALDATIGLGADIASATSKTGANPENTQSSTTVSTAAFNTPWNIFNTNVAARYYF